MKLSARLNETIERITSDEPGVGMSNERFCAWVCYGFAGIVQLISFKSGTDSGARVFEQVLAGATAGFGEYNRRQDSRIRAVGETALEDEGVPFGPVGLEYPLLVPPKSAPEQTEAPPVRHLRIVPSEAA